MLEPPVLGYKNPYYEVADIYEPCDNTAENFGAASKPISRGHGSGVHLKELAGDVTVNLTQALGMLVWVGGLHCRVIL